MNEKLHGKHHRYALKPLYRRAKMFLSRKQESKAIPLLKRVIEKSDASSVKTSALQLEAANDLLQVYERDGKGKEIEALQKKIAIIQGFATEESDHRSMLVLVVEEIQCRPMLSLMLPLFAVFIFILRWYMNKGQGPLPA